VQLLQDGADGFVALLGQDLRGIEWRPSLGFQYQVLEVLLRHG
jgi:hypothetical protein